MVPKERKKKWMLLGIPVLFLCLICGCEANGESGTYSVRRINSTAQGDDYFLMSSSEIWEYSVSGQEVENSYGNGQNIDCFAADDDYVFFVVNATSPFLDGEMWRVDRRTGTYELFMKTDAVVPGLALADGYLFYGRYGVHSDMYVCPVDGNPETDSVSLWEQFADDESRKQWKETVYQGWRIQQYDDRIVLVTDVESGEEIYNTSIRESSLAFPIPKLVFMLLC